MNNKAIPNKKHPKIQKNHLVHLTDFFFCLYFLDNFVCVGLNPHPHFIKYKIFALCMKVEGRLLILNPELAVE